MGCLRRMPTQLSFFSHVPLVKRRQVIYVPYFSQVSLNNTKGNHPKLETQTLGIQFRRELCQVLFLFSGLERDERLGNVL